MEAEPFEIVSAKNNILDQLIDDKIKNIVIMVQADIDHIFKELNETVHDKDIVEKTFAKLEPVQENVKNETEVETQALENLMKTVPKESREQVQNVHRESQTLSNSVNEVMTFLNHIIN